MNDNDLPQAEGLGLSSESVESIANEFRRLLGITDPKAVDLFEVVSALGGKVEVVPGSERDFRGQGTLEVRSRDDWAIYIPEHSSPLDDRFTLAHELGHFILHSEIGAKPIRAFRRFDSRDEVTLAEREADAFALSLLMPRDCVLEELNTYGPDLDILAASFAVDKEAAATRLRWIKDGEQPASAEQGAN